MADNRPDPDRLLVRVQAEESRAARGKLKIFFGYAAGVGKTFAMLEAARREKAEGVDVVVGYIEPHGRAQTEALLSGLEALPTRSLDYQAVTLREFDLDEALSRRPKLLLVDELAHTNAPGSRHAKRWQDVEELLAAGIDVHTTLNVQHLESLNDVIAQITGVIVRETLPDAVIERADEIELIDVTPDELVERLQAGKVYIPRQADRALQNFFQKGNLVALRELTLREAADRLQKDVESARNEKEVKSPWATRDRLLVCVGSSPTSARLIRTAKRLADALNAEWLAVAVNTRGDVSTSDDSRQRIARHLALASRLGAETRVLVAPNAATALLEYARDRNVSKIIIGKTSRPWWSRLLGSGVIEKILEGSGDIDVYIIRGKSEGPPLAPPAPRTRPTPWKHYLASAAIVVLCGLLGWASRSWRLAEANIVMVFLLGVVVVATRYGRGPAIATAIVNVLVFDFFFVPPYFTFSVNDAQYLITFAIMLGIGLLVSALTIRIHERLLTVQRQERRTTSLYRLTKQLSEVVGLEFLIAIAGRQLMEIFGGEVVLYIREQGRSLELRFGAATAIAQLPVNQVVAQWVADHDRPAGLETDTLPNATALFLPLMGSQRTVGAVGVRPADTQRFLDPDQRRLLETCASLIALSIERDQSVLQAQQATIQAETEQMRSSLLSSVSHDLRTPLASITGAATSLQDASMPAEDRNEMLGMIVSESRRLLRLVENLLEMSRLESGSALPNRQWHVLEEIVGSAIAQVRRDFGDRTLHVSVPDDLPLLYLDNVLVEQVLVNLLENAARYTPTGCRVEITARVMGREVEIRVADNGLGLPAGMEERIFEKFVRGPTHTADSRSGVGLGLAICRAAVQAHGGRITARNRPEGGVEFLITMPLLGPPPAAESRSEPGSE